MRAILALGVALGFLACASFRDGDSSAPQSASEDAGVDAPPPVEAGADGMSTSDADGGPRPCAQRSGDLVCEDFEEPSPFSGWYEHETNGGEVSAISVPTRGGRVLSARLAMSSLPADAQISQDKPLPLPLHVRFYAYLDEPLENTGFHVLFVLSDNELGFAQGRLVVNQFTAPIIYETATSLFPVKKWACIEWSLTASATKLLVDGTTQVDVTNTKMLPATFVGLGLTREPSATVARTMLFDDLVVSSTPVACD